MSHHPPPVRAAHTYLASLTLPASCRELLHIVAEARLKRRNCTPSQARLATILHLSRRQVVRVVDRLTAAGLLRRHRRGRRLTNIYLLGRALWRRLTGQPKRRLDPDVQGTLFRIGTVIGVSVEEMARNGVRPPPGSDGLT